MSLLSDYRASRPRRFNKAGAIEGDAEWLRNTATEAFHEFRKLFAKESSRCYPRDLKREGEIIVCPEDWEMLLVQIVPYIEFLPADKPRTEPNSHICGVKIRREKGDFRPRISYSLGE